MYVMVAAAIALTLWSLVRSLRMQSSDGIINNIKTSKIAWAVVIFTLAVLLITFALGSTAPMKINGRLYDDSLWLRLSDMFVNTSLLMLLAAAAAYVFGMTRYIRRKNPSADADKKGGQE